MFKKYLIMLLCLALVFSMTAVCAFAEEGDAGNAPGNTEPSANEQNVNEEEQEEDAELNPSNDDIMPPPSPSIDTETKLTISGEPLVSSTLKLTATVTCGGSPVNYGQVKFSFGGEENTVNVSGGTASCSFTASEAGSLTVTALYLGYDNASPQLSASSDSQNITIYCTYPTSIAVSTDAAVPAVGKAVKLLTAVVDTANNGPVNGGKVQFYVDGEPAGTASVTTSTVDSKKVSGASLSYTFKKVGPHVISVKYTGNDKYDSSEATMNITVYSATALSLSVSPSWSKAPASITLTAVLKDSAGKPLAAKPINFKYATNSKTTYDKAKVISGSPVVTDANGKATIKLELSKNGTYYVFAGFEGEVSPALEPTAYSPSFAAPYAAALSAKSEAPVATALALSDGVYLGASLATATVTISNVAPTGDDFNAPLWIAVVLLSVGTCSYILVRRREDF